MENNNRRARAGRGSANHGDEHQHPWGAEEGFPLGAIGYGEDESQQDELFQQPGRRPQQLPLNPQQNVREHQLPSNDYGLMRQQSIDFGHTEEHFFGNDEGNAGGNGQLFQGEIDYPTEPSPVNQTAPRPSRRGHIEQPRSYTGSYQNDIAYELDPPQEDYYSNLRHNVDIPEGSYTAGRPNDYDQELDPFQGPNPYGQQLVRQPYQHQPHPRSNARPHPVTGFDMGAYVDADEWLPPASQPVRQSIGPTTVDPRLIGYLQPPTFRTGALSQRQGDLVPERGLRRPGYAQAPSGYQAYPSLGHGTSKHRPPPPSGSGYGTQFGLSIGPSRYGLTNFPPPGQTSNGQSAQPQQDRPTTPFPPPGRRRAIVGRSASSPHTQPQDDAAPSKKRARQLSEDAEEGDETSEPPARKRKKQRSSRQQRMNHGEVIENEDGSLRFRAWHSTTWEPAIRHERVRRAMLVDMGRLGTYTHEPTQGEYPDDRTAFHPQQRRWRFQGHHGWHGSQNATLYRFERGNLQTPTYAPGPLRFQNYVVVNEENQAITNWRNMPLTISTMIEGGRMEQIQREDGRIANHDFRDRMPSRSGTKPTPGLSAFGNRKIAFRKFNGLVAWDLREGTDTYRELVSSHLSDAQLEANTTEGFNGLSKKEFQKVKKDNQSTGHYKARGNRKAKEESEDELAESKGSKSAGRGKRKRRRDEEEDDYDHDPEEDEDESG